MLPCGEVICCCVCIIVYCSYYQTQCCHVGRLPVVVSVSLYVVTITRHSVAMWGGYLLLCLYHCILQLLPDTVLPCGEVASCCVCIIVCCNYYQTQCCHVGRLPVVVSVSLYVVTITRHSVAMWGGCQLLCLYHCMPVVVSVSLYVVTITRHSVAMWGGYLLLCLYHCMLQLLPDTVLPCGEVASCCVCIIVCCNYYQTQCCHVGRLPVVVSVSLYIATITRHSVAMWGGCQLLCLYHCML